MISNSANKTIEENLDRARVEAAITSKGISSDVIYTAVLKALSKTEASGKILDFGAGTGALTVLLCEQERFSEITAADIIDFSSGVSHPKVRWVFGDLNQSLAEASETFDAIVAAEVIEHLENPRVLAREWFQFLKPGGWVVLSTPNNESWRSVSSLLFRGHYAGFIGASYPAHITALLAVDMQRILDEAGFDSIRFSYSDYGVLPKLVRYSWQQISLGALRGKRYSDNIVCVARKPLG